MSSTFLDAIHADPWADDFLDLPELNAPAAEAIEEQIRRVRQAARTAPRSLTSTSIVVVGPPGAGKTHLFARIRRRLGPRAVFVHVRPLVHAPMTPRFVLGEVVKQLGYRTQDLAQIDALVGSLLAHLSGAGVSFPTAFLSEYQQLEGGEREARLEQVLEQVIATWQEIDEQYLRRLLQVPFATSVNQRALLAWLSGRDCDEAQLARIGATASLAEDLAVSALRTICAVASPGAPIVVVFDQLENLIDPGETGPRLAGYANLAAELVDAMRGLVLVHMALDTEWNRGIEPVLGLSQRSRLLMQRETLALPTPKQKEELLRLWIERVPDRAGPFPWPFADADLARVVRTPGMTPRMLLIECRQALSGDTSLLHQEATVTDAQTGSAPTQERSLGEEWESCLDAARNTLKEASEQRACVDAARLADGLLTCGRFLQQAKLHTKGVKAPAQLTLDAEDGKWAVAVLNQGHHKSLGAALAKLTKIAAEQPVLVLRERARDLPPTWKDTHTKRDALLSGARARWLWLESDDVVKLLALDSLLQAARSGDVTDERGKPVSERAVVGWAQDTLNVKGWGIVQSMLRKADDAAQNGSEPIVGKDAETSSFPSAPAPPSGVALSIVRQLRIASVDRVVREAVRVSPNATRASILAELEGRPGDVQFFGRTIVCVRAQS